MYLGIDLGGTKIEAVVLSGEAENLSGEILFRERIGTPKGDYRGTLDAISGLVAKAEALFGAFDKLGIGTPGAVSAKTGRMKNCNSTCLNGEYLVEDLELRLGKPVIQANDANCFALSEAVDGSAQADGVVFGVILGTGVGGGIVVDKKVLPGVNRICGEWGHNPLPVSVLPDGEKRACYCGKDNCIETYLSGSGFVRTYQLLKGEAEAFSESEIMAQDIAVLLDQKEGYALQALDLYSRQLAASLSGVINILDPDSIVLGGGMSKVNGLSEKAVRWLPQFVFSDSLETKVRLPMFGDSSGVRGAAWLARH